MRIKFLSVIVSFLIVSIAVSSCLDSDNNSEYSSDATIKAFALDTIYGKRYEFTIDQLNKLIYNRDSLPLGADTIIDSILIKTLDVNWQVTSGVTDTAVNISNVVNLLPAMNKSGDEGIKFKVHAADGVTTRMYTLQVRVHQQDPDSLVWKNMEEYGSVFSATTTSGAQRSVILNNNLLVYTSNTTVYKTSTTQYAWSQSSVSNLPSDAKLTSVLNFQDKLYMITTGGDLYVSNSDGTTWQRVSGVSRMQALVACLAKNDINDTPATIVGIQQDEQGEHFFSTSTDGQTWSTNGNEKVLQGFPTENIYSTILTTANGVEKVVLVGMPQADKDVTTPWFSMNGKGWADMGNTAYDTFCPGMDNPFIMYYGDKLYSFGGSLEAIYSSVTGLAWHQTKKKFLLPKEFKGKGSYSITIDKNNFIWVVFGGKGIKNEVWRGRLNKLGFKE